MLENGNEKEYNTLINGHEVTDKKKYY